MNLLQVRTKFVQLSGRYDLVADAAGDDYSDNGADFYINEGVHLLGKLAQVPASRAKLFFALTAGDYSVNFQHNCRIILEVWANNSEERFPLEKVSLYDLKEVYYKLAADTTQDEPAYYALADMRALETTEQESLGTFIELNHAEADTKYDYRGVIIVPPVDEAYVIEVKGLFKNVALSSDNDENFWTIQEPMLLLRAALYQLESMWRGTENAKNWLSAIQTDVGELNKDVAEEESAFVTQMEG